MKEVSFALQMDPVGKGRPRISRGRCYTPPKTAEAEAKLAIKARDTMQNNPPIEGPVDLWLHVVMPMPPSWSKKKREEHNGRYHAQKPDLDNIIKLVCDGALNGIVIKDDAQIATVEHARKTWGEAGSLSVTVRALSP